MAVILQEAITGSDSTYTVTGSRVALDVDIGSGVVINIGSVSATVDSVYIQSGANIVGSTYELQTLPDDVTKNNPSFDFLYFTSGTGGATGSQIGSIIQYIGTGSKICIFSYNSGLISSIGSWI